MAKCKAVERPYESLFICAADVPQKTIDEFSEKIKKILSETSGTLRSVQNWGRRRLTYPIKHNREGQFIYIDFNGTGKSAQLIGNLFRVTDLVLRHMTVGRVDKPVELPSVAPAPAAVVKPDDLGGSSQPPEKK